MDTNFAVGNLDGKFQTEVLFRRYADFRLSKVLVVVVMFLLKRRREMIYPASDDDDEKEPERITVIVKNVYAVNTVIP